MAVQALPIPKPYKRLGAFPLDEDSVFYDLASMDAYIAGGSAYPGHIVSLVSIVQNKVDTFKILPDKSYVATGGTDEKNKGWKATEAQLNTDLPVGQNGWFALVGETDTFWTWDADTNTWVNTDSKQAPISVDANPIEGSINPVSSGGVYAALFNKADKSHTHAIDAVPTKGSNNPVASDGIYKLIKKTFKVESTTDYGVIGYDEAFKITSVVAADGLTVSIKKSDDTDYTLGDIIAAFDELHFFGDVEGKLFTVKGEIV